MTGIPVAQWQDIEGEDCIMVKLPIHAAELEEKHDEVVLARSLGDRVYGAAMELIRKREREEDRAARTDQG
jgi:hypothetical protein